MLEKKDHQPPLTVEKQIENLKTLNLIINDEEYASSFLNYEKSTSEEMLSENELHINFLCFLLPIEIKLLTIPKSNNIINLRKAYF